MSDGTLVERVARELTDHWNSADIVNGRTQAVVAIRAVAEWINSGPPYYPEMLIAKKLLDELDPTTPEGK